jgi:hypothetical protein
VGAAVDETHPAYAGQAMYSRPALALYDALVYGFNFPVLWRCPKARLVELYDAHVGARHLDIGVATGRLLDECRFPVATPEITLMDLNPNSLAAASRRLGTSGRFVRLGGDVQPAALPSGHNPRQGGRFRACRRRSGAGWHPIRRDDSLRGGEPYLALPARGRRRQPSRVMCNLDDHLGDLDSALGGAFVSHEGQIVGAMALFRASTR